MRLTESWVGTAGLGKIILVRRVEGPKGRFRGGGHIAGEILDHNRHGLHRGPLLQPTEIIPLPPRRIPHQGRLMEHQHRAGGQFRSQCLEEVLLRQGKRSEPQPGENLVELLLADEVAGPLP